MPKRHEQLRQTYGDTTQALPRSVVALAQDTIFKTKFVLVLIAFAVLLTLIFSLPMAPRHDVVVPLMNTLALAPVRLALAPQVVIMSQSKLRIVQVWVNFALALRPISEQMKRFAFVLFSSSV